VGAPLPEGVDAARSRPRHGDAATWIRRAVLAALAIGVVLGLANTFGQRPSVSQADASAASLEVTAPADVRGGLVFQVRIQIVAHRPLAKPALVFSPSWFESMTTNSIAPQPSSQTSLDGAPEFQLSAIGRGRLATYWFYFQANPTNGGWQRPETLTLLDNGAPIATIRRTISIYP
jgi:hypothetical protein